MVCLPLSVFPRLLASASSVCEGPCVPLLYILTVIGGKQGLESLAATAATLKQKGRDNICINTT